MNSSPRARWSLTTVFWLMFITFMSLRPDSGGGTPSLKRMIVMNSLHFPAYLVLSFILINLYNVWTRWAREWAFLAAVLTAFLYGVLMEFLQGFCPGREPSAGDALINLTGAIFAVWLYRKIKNGVRSS